MYQRNTKTSHLRLPVPAAPLDGDDHPQAHNDSCAQPTALFSNQSGHLLGSETHQRLWFNKSVWQVQFVTVKWLALPTCRLFISQTPRCKSFCCIRQAIPECWIISSQGNHNKLGLTIVPSIFPDALLQQLDAAKPVYYQQLCFNPHLSKHVYSENGLPKLSGVVALLKRR